VNALTALVRTIDLGVDARTSLSAAQITAIAGWRTRVEDTNARICRQEAVRLAQRIRTLDGEITSNRATVTKLIAQDTPQLLELTGVGAIVAASVLVAWSHPVEFALRPHWPHWLEPARSRVVGQYRAPPPQPRRRPPAESRLTTIVIVRMRTDPQPAPTSPVGEPRGERPRKSCAP